LSGFSEIQSALAKWPQEPVSGHVYADNSLERLRIVLAGLQRGDGFADAGDLAGLIRHVLRRQTVLYPASAPALRVPRQNCWPGESLWKESHVEVVSQDSTSFLLRVPLAWSAEWLPGSKHTPPLCAAFAEEPRRDSWPSTPRLALDPALVDGLGLSFQYYSCPGQRQAIQAAFFLRPGGTLVVNLPTGFGKSLVAWAPALLAPPRTLTLMVTPTVALAIDQERQLREQYHPDPVVATARDVGMAQRALR
jgi:ATP-dependent DNA helicase RecQ